MIENLVWNGGAALRSDDRISSTCREVVKERSTNENHSDTAVLQHSKTTTRSSCSEKGVKIAQKMRVGRGIHAIQ